MQRLEEGKKAHADAQALRIEGEYETWQRAKLGSLWIIVTVLIEWRPGCAHAARRC
jgi:hypothetical protein